MDRSLQLDLRALSRPPEQLSDEEKRWAGYYPYLLAKGYQLRARYRPGWIPSWQTDGRNPLVCEDSWDALVLQPFRTLDALHVRDQRWVIIKMVLPSTQTKEGHQEVEILQRFSSGDLANNPANHVVPCLDTFPVPDIDGGIFYVMPLLTRYDRPPFWCLGEIRDLLFQLFEGLMFLHQHNVAHCDIAGANVMMDGRPLYSEQFHPLNQMFSLDGRRIVKPRGRSGLPIRYYYIDFGYSVWNRAEDPKFRIEGIEAREPAPEQAEGNFYDPFAVDVFQLGAILRGDLIPEIPRLRFLLPLARAMTENDPKKRISLPQAQILLYKAFAAQGSRRMRWPLIPKGVGIKRWIAYTAVGLFGDMFAFVDALLSIGRRV
ncbi:hypothetical protein FRC06_011851, partial [Ceratobasidium sp. 370]